MTPVPRRAILALALLCASATSGRADTTAYALTAAWQKVAAAGQSVDVQNTGGKGYAVLSTATGGAPSGASGQAIGPGEHRFYTLGADLYALGAGPVVVTTGFSAGGASGNPAAAQFGQVRITTTGTAVQLPSLTGTNGFIVEPNSRNTGVGGFDVAGASGVSTTCDGTGNGSCHPPGQPWSFGVTSAGAVYVNGAAGDVFYVYGN